MKKIITLFLLLSIFHTSFASAEIPGREYYEKRAEELKDLRWGMFICWSFSTFSGSEWTPTRDKDVSFFRAETVDTDQWARTAKEAEMGYILFLTKHHDGFCLWDTATTEKKVTNAPLGVDVLAELKKSCDKYGIKLAIYFSEADWDDPNSPGDGHGQGAKDPERKKAQLKELLTNYGPIEYIWFDHAVGDGGLSHEKTVKFCHEIQPHTLIGFNHGESAGEVRVGERGRPSPLSDFSGAGPYNQDASVFQGFLVAEFTYPILPPCGGGADWFYSLPIHDGLCHTPRKIHADYLGAVKHRNIFCLNVGPDYEGNLREIDVQTLRKVGDKIRSGEIPGDSLSRGKPATASSQWDDEHRAQMAVDHDPGTRWGAAHNSRSGWLEVDLREPKTFSRVMIDDTQFPRTEEFLIEYRDDPSEAWKTAFHGGKIGGDEDFTFPAVTGRYVRLNILKANEVPTIWEFQVYEK